MANNLPLAEGRTEKRLVAALIATALFLTSLPYLLGYAITPPGMHFIGTAYNIDDYCNYLSWLRQTADGHFFLRNLFTTDPQKGLEFNVFFWLLGLISRLTTLSPQAMLQIARVCGGLGLLLLVYRFARHCLPNDPAARLTAFGLVCLSSGFGWVNWPLWQDHNPPGSPIDAWQPEAYTFLSLYTSALFTVSTLLIVGALYALLLGEQTGEWRYPVIAGLCGAALGNMHSYDVLHIAAAWGLFLIVWTILKGGRGVMLSWARGLLALGLTLPTTLYQYYVFKAEAVFHARAEVKTLSPAFWHYILGYGLVFLLAVFALLWLLTRVSAIRKASDAAMIVLICWAVAGLAIIYLPVAFQRKMLMGEHIPLCLLAGTGASLLTARLSLRLRPLVLAAIVLLSFPSNAFFLRRDMTHLVANKSETTNTTGQVPRLDDHLLDAYAWLRHNTRAEDGILGFPNLCTALPGYTGRAVWAGHWGETPQFGRKVTLFSKFADIQTLDEARRAFLAQTKTRYLLYLNDVSALNYTSASGIPHEFADFAHAPPPYLIPVYRSKEYTIFRIDL